MTLIASYFATLLHCRAFAPRARTGTPSRSTTLLQKTPTLALWRSFSRQKSRPPPDISSAVAGRGSHQKHGRIATCRTRVGVSDRKSASRAVSQHVAGSLPSKLAMTPTTYARDGTTAELFPALGVGRTAKTTLKYVQ